MSLSCQFDQFLLYMNRYELVQYIPPTSNIAERFFSQAGIVLSPQRQAMAPAQLENILFLKTNRRYWNVAMVQMVGKQN